MSINRIIISGHLGADPEIKQAGESKVCNVRIATSEKRKDASGEVKEITDWHTCVFWNKAAEVMQRSAQKGTHILIEGKQQTRSYTGKDGVMKYVTENIVTSFELLGNLRSNHVGGQDYSRQDPAETTYTASKDDPLGF